MKYINNYITKTEIIFKVKQWQIKTPIEMSLFMMRGFIFVKMPKQHLHQV